MCAARMSQSMRRKRPCTRSFRGGFVSFGNAMTGLRAAALPPCARLAAAGRVLERERTLSDRPPGSAFFSTRISNRLAAIAVSQGRADRDLGLAIGIPVEIVS